jgi:hypothetical protein
MQRRKILQYLPVAFAISASPGQLLEMARRAHGMAFKPETSRDILLLALVDTILPATSTPSASEAGVPAFIELTMVELVSSTDREDFYTALDQFGSQCVARKGMRFDEMTSTTQHAYLSERMQDEDGFCMQLKQLTLVAYYSSREGMTKALDYNPIPGTYDPCVKVTADTKSEASYF